MKSLLVSALIAPLIVGCASTGPMTSWGKEGVSMTDYRVDGAYCAVMAANAQPGDNGANTAGGINGKNSSLPSSPAVSTGIGSGSPSGASFPTGGGGAYRDSAPPDVVSRAAQQQRTQELAVQRAKADTLKSCLSGKGYVEFRLTPEQQKKLATLAEGSDARREYLYQLGTDPAVLKSSNVR